MSDELRRKTFERAVKLLAAKPRSVGELRERLLQGKGVKANKSVVETVIARLRDGVSPSEANAQLQVVVKQQQSGEQHLDYPLLADVRTVPRSRRHPH